MIFKKPVHDKFTSISNEICNNVSISPDARWCLWYLLTKPKDWEVRIDDIRKSSGWGRDKAKNVINELIDARYIVKRQERADGGQFAINVYDVYDFQHDDLPITENPLTEKPLSANTSLTKDLVLQNTDRLLNTNNNINNISPVSGFEDDFKEFWAVYPKRPNNSKKSALAKYVAARKRGVLHETIMAGLKPYAMMRNREVEQGSSPTFTKMAETWLSKECWANDYAEVKSPANVSAPSPELMVSDEDFDKLAAIHPGFVANRERAKKALTDQMAKGATLSALCEAAEKYKLYKKFQAYEGNDSPAQTLENWLKFSWEDMGQYEFYWRGDNIKSVRVKGQKKSWRV